mmetsp:Transcript_84196/g.225137  ORF Transcript_84196/g.225137 Transcript_84196/m.225137 type:complete len:212 (-) Transcript_84196:108-743(-)
MLTTTHVQRAPAPCIRSIHAASRMDELPHEMCCIIITAKMQRAAAINIRHRRLSSSRQQQGHQIVMTPSHSPVQGGIRPRGVILVDDTPPAEELLHELDVSVHTCRDQRDVCILFLRLTSKTMLDELRCDLVMAGLASQSQGGLIDGPPTHGAGPALQQKLHQWQVTATRSSSQRCVAVRIHRVHVQASSWIIKQTLDQVQLSVEAGIDEL